MQRCRSEFPFRNFTIDHIIPKSRGGTDHIENLPVAMRALQQRQGRPAARIPGGQIERAGDRGVISERHYGRRHHRQYVEAGVVSVSLRYSKRPISIAAGVPLVLEIRVPEA